MFDVFSGCIGTVIFYKEDGYWYFYSFNYDPACVALDISYLLQKNGAEEVRTKDMMPRVENIEQFLSQLNSEDKTND